MAKNLMNIDGNLAPLPLRTFKGQVQFADGRVVNIDCQALDYVTAMIKLAATICDHPVPVMAWFMRDETSPIIAPFPAQALPKEPGV